MTPLLLSLVLAAVPGEPESATETVSEFEQPGYYLLVSPLSFSFYEAKRPVLWGPTLGLGHAWGAGGTRVAAGFRAQGLLRKAKGVEYLEQRYIAEVRAGRSGRRWFAFALLGAGLSKSTATIVAGETPSSPGVAESLGTSSSTFLATAFAVDVGVGASILVGTHISLGAEWVTGLNFAPGISWSMTPQVNLGVHW